MTLFDDPRIYFALERTFLAWIRTGLGLVGIGFAVSRFGLFLREIRDTPVVTGRATDLSVISGVALVSLGVIVIVGAIVHHLRTTRQLQTGMWTPGASTAALILGATLALFGTGLAVALLIR